MKLQDFKDERELCEVCGKTDKRSKGRSGKVPLLECEKCLRAFHSDCCSPPLKKVPEVHTSRSPHMRCDVHRNKDACSETACAT